MGYKKADGEEWHLKELMGGGEKSRTSIFFSGNLELADLKQGMHNLQLRSTPL